MQIMTKEYYDRRWEGATYSVNKSMLTVEGTNIDRDHVDMYLIHIWLNERIYTQMTYRRNHSMN